MGSVFNKELTYIWPNYFYTSLWGAYAILRWRLGDDRLIEVVGEKHSPAVSENPSIYFTHFNRQSVAVSVTRRLLGAMCEFWLYAMEHPSPSEVDRFTAKGLPVTIHAIHPKSVINKYETFRMYNSFNP